MNSKKEGEPRCVFFVKNLETRSSATGCGISIPRIMDASFTVGGDLESDSVNMAVATVEQR